MYEDRKKQFEKKFELDEEKKFKVIARRNKHLALWAAELLSISDNNKNEYIKEVLESDFREPGDEDIVEKIKEDFDRNAVNISKDEIRDKIEYFLEISAKELEN